ncbi:MAG: polysaccharide deacetylase family protein [Clostridia bacterium]|nr:polysaccharide deacetylase family protein [Clostridia bacterium]
MNSFLLRFPQGKSKLFTISYDDGVEQDIQLVELMKKYGIKGTFNINSRRFAPEGKCWPEGFVQRRMTAYMTKKAYDTPLVEVAVHGAAHLYPSFVPSSVAMCEFIDDRRELEKMFGRLIRGGAYPFGRYNDDTIDILSKAGIVYCRTTVATKTFDLPGNWLKLDPTCHHNDPRLFELCDRFLSEEPRYLPYFFYVWGHSYEFEDRDNWDRIEQLFKCVSGKEEVWYCTNIEAYDYIKAYEQLIFSADGSIVHNPTATDLWANCDGNTVHIPAGETVTL